MVYVHYWLLATALLIAPCAGKLVTFDNTKPRLDSAGAILKAHDGTTQRFGSDGSFFYHAMGYPACNETGRINGCNYSPLFNGTADKTCIYGRDNSLLVYSSPDLSSGSWKLLQTVYPSAVGNFPSCTYFRSQAVYNPTTRKYVLWVNTAGCDADACPDAPNGKCAAYVMGTSESAGGPFTFIGTAEPTAASMQHAGGIGDYALFVDTDSQGYIILTHGIDGPGHRDMYIFKLTPDFLSFESSSSVKLPGPHLVEAPAFFRRGNSYYALLGGCTCMGLYGGGVAVLRSKHPLGPWTNVTSALDPGCPMAKQKSCFEMGPGAVCNPVTQAQQNYVVEVPLANGSTAYVWTGDRWQQSPDLKYDEQPQTWLPLSFDGDGNILPLQMVDRFELDIAV